MCLTISVLMPCDCLAQDGYGEFQVAQKMGERADMFKMYLKPAIKRGNLKVGPQILCTLGCV